MSDALDDYRWLTCGEANAFLSSLSGDGAPLVQQVARLRKQLSAERVHVLMQQHELRQRARAKFSRADEMLFTGVGLEQATDEWVAAYKARRFPVSGEVVDLCSGIGGDLQALAARGTARGVDAVTPLPLGEGGRRPGEGGPQINDGGRPGDSAMPPHRATASPPSPERRRVELEALAARGGTAHGVDRDPICALLAAYNAQVDVTAADCSIADVEHAAAWHIDPDRRSGGQRTIRVVDHEPDATALEALLAANEHGAIKLAPAAEWPDHWTTRAEWEWISREGECRQLVAWFGALAEQRGQRTATIVARRGGSYRTVVERLRARTLPPLGPIEQVLYEADAAVFASGLLASLAAEHDLHGLDPNSGYLSGPYLSDALADPALAAFAVRDVLPLDTRRLKAYLRERGCATLEIKKRGVDVDPHALRKLLRVPGAEQATLLLTPYQGQHVAIVAERIRTEKPKP